MKIGEKTISSTQHTAHGTRSEIKKADSLYSVARFCLLSAVCCLLATGCIYRKLTIKTEPPGALIYLNDNLIGESPLSYDFVWYAWYRVTVRKSGYERIEDRRKLSSPFYFWIPFDLVMEVMPFPITDAHTWSYTLYPVSEVDPIPTPELIEASSDLLGQDKAN